MSKTGRTNHRRGTRRNPRPEREISVRSVRRDPPDLRKLSRAVIALAMQEAEAEAKAAAANDGSIADASDHDDRATPTRNGTEVSHDD